MSKNEDCTLIVQTELLKLSAQKAIYWPGEKALIIADVHLGKTALFRQHGIPVPASILSSDLHRLSSLIASYQPKKLIVVGDMFHQDFNTDLQVFTDWRNSFDKLQIILVQGNHDILPMIQYRYMGIDLYNPNLNMAPFHFIHKQEDAAHDWFTISGHIHPGVRLTGPAKQAIKLPCFRVADNNIVLPAFSAFTGLDVSKCEVACDYYAVVGEGVLKVQQ